MTDQSDSHRGTRLLFIAAALVIIIYGINQAQSVVALFLLSVFLALIGTPPVLWLERKRVPSFIAVMCIEYLPTNFIPCMTNFQFNSINFSSQFFTCN